MSKSKKLKKFSLLEVIVLEDFIKNVEDRNYLEIIADSQDLDSLTPLAIIKKSLRDKITLGELDIEALTYLATADKTDLATRLSCIRIVIHRVATGCDYPYSKVITRERFLEDAFIPTIKIHLIALKILIGENDAQDSKREGTNSVETSVFEIKAKEEELGRSSVISIEPKQLDRRGEATERPIL